MGNKQKNCYNYPIVKGMIAEYLIGDVVIGDVVSELT
jgi:hypothetical protein